MISPQNCNESYAGYTWQIGKKYGEALQAQVGYDLSNSCGRSFVMFLGNSRGLLRSRPMASSWKV